MFYNIQESIGFLMIYIQFKAMQDFFSINSTGMRHVIFFRRQNIWNWKALERGTYLFLKLMAPIITRVFIFACY